MYTILVTFQYSVSRVLYYWNILNISRLAEASAAIEKSSGVNSGALQFHICIIKYAVIEHSPLPGITETGTGTPFALCAGIATVFALIIHGGIRPHVFHQLIFHTAADFDA